MKTYLVVGKIGSGKSTVCAIMEQTAVRYGLKTLRLDLDTIAKDVSKQAFVTKQLKAAFGSFACASDLAKKAFKTKESTKVLNSIVHPAVFKKLDEVLEVAKNEEYDIVIIEESAFSGEDDKGVDIADFVVCVSAPSYLRQKLALARGMSLEDYIRRNALQISQTEMEHMADFIISNVSNIGELNNKIEELFKN